jgi:hypothetical protein
MPIPASLNHQIRDYYSGCSLPENKLHAIHALSQRMRKNHQRSLISFLTFIVLTVVCGFYFAYLYEDQKSTSPEFELFAVIDMNLPIEIDSNNYESLETKLIQIPYSIQPPQDFVPVSWNLIGARYQPIQNSLGVLLYYTDSESSARNWIWVSDQGNHIQYFPSQQIVRKDNLIFVKIEKPGTR